MVFSILNLLGPIHIIIFKISWHTVKNHFKRPQFDCNAESLRRLSLAVSYFLSVPRSPRFVGRLDLFTGPCSVPT